MIQRTTVSILVLSLVAFLGGLIGSIRAQSQPEAPKGETAPADPPPWGRCLGISPERMTEIEALDPTFRTDLAQLRAELAERRQNLADLFETADSSDQDIRAAVEQIIETRTLLERRVTEHLLVVRHELNPQQQKKLFDIFAEGVRQGHGRGWGRGHGRGGGRGGWDAWRGRGGRGDDGRQGRGRGHRNAHGGGRHGDGPPDAGPQ